MKIENYHPPKSSFLSINKDMRLLVDKFLSLDFFLILELFS